MLPALCGPSAGRGDCLLIKLVNTMTHDDAMAMGPPLQRQQEQQVGALTGNWMTRSSCPDGSHCSAMASDRKSASMRSSMGKFMTFSRYPRVRCSSISNSSLMGSYPLLGRGL